MAVGATVINGNSALVLGVGAGVFVLIFFLLLSIIVCALGSRSTWAPLVYAISTAVLAVVVIVLFASPRGKAPSTGLDYTPEGYRNNIGVVVVTVLMGAAVLCSGLFLLLFHVQVPVYARPLSYRLDVLKQ